VVPLFDEEDNVAPLHDAIRRAIEPLRLDYELLFVDDGSRDRTFERAREIAARDPRLRIIRFRRNTGQTGAMKAGFDHARGRVLVTMDGDLQNDPEDIRVLLERLTDGVDIVCGRRVRRNEPWLSRRLPSLAANRLIAWGTGIPVRDNGCTLRAYRAQVIRETPLYSEMHRFLPAMVSMAGGRIAEVDVRDRPRHSGRSKYGLSRIYRVAMDLLLVRMLLHFASRPLRWFCRLAWLPGLLGLSGLAWFVARTTFLADRSSYLMAGGSGLLFIALAGHLVLVGALGEWVCRSSHLGPETFARSGMSIDRPRGPAVFGDPG
jgi:glycosyltransferase involved in cell wall biosynthesis